LIFAVYKRKLLTALSCFVVMPVLCACSPSPEEKSIEVSNPNIVLILIDDMGFNDLGVNGNNDVRTPNLDSLASQGVRFTRHYVDSTCSPTRVGVLTGTEPINHGFVPDGRGISPEVKTLPETLRDAGYTTHHIGKWHVGHTTPLAWPNQQGFDTFFGFLSQFLLRGPQVEGEFTYKRPTYRNPWLQIQNDPAQRYEGQLSEILTNRAVSLIDSKRGSDQPWFLNFWTYAPHAPIQPMVGFASKYPDTPEGRYRALLEQVDNTVGEIIEALERNKLAENTLLIVASDNGGTNKQIDNNAPYFGTKGTFLEGGVRTPLIIRWPGEFPAGAIFEKTVSNFDYFPTIAKAAGATLPHEMPGRDLAWVVANDIDLDKPLFWEASNSEIHGWGGLSRDGRWRVSQYFVGGPVLNDLIASPSGEVDVLDENPDVADSMHQEYLNWRHKRRLIPFNYNRSSARGQATITGSSFQRNPGFGGHTFTIAVTPDVTEGSIERIGKEVIAYQRDLWSLSVVGNKLIANVNGIILESQAPPPGECSTVVLASHFVYSALYPDLNRAQIQLYLNGELVDSNQVKHPEILDNDLLQPTHIGQDANEQFSFRGILGRPVIYNERLVTDKESDSKVENSVARAIDKLCI